MSRQIGKLTEPKNDLRFREGPDRLTQPRDCQLHSLSVNSSYLVLYNAEGEPLPSRLQLNANVLSAKRQCESCLTVSWSMTLRTWKLHVPRARAKCSPALNARVFSPLYAYFPMSTRKAI